MLSVWRLPNWAAEKALTLRNRAQRGLLESHLGQGTGSTCHLPGPFWRPPFLKPQHNVANFVSSPLFSTYLFWPADLPEKYTLSAPLPSLQNKRGKTLSTDPPPTPPTHPPAVTLLGCREKRQGLCLGATLLADAVSNQQASYRICCNKERLVKGEARRRLI